MSLSLSPDSTAIITKALSTVGDLATLPEITIRIIQIVDDPKSTARDLHEVIKYDPALSARILKVVNSAFYGLPGQIATVERAIIMLGLSAVKNISIATSLTKMFRGSKLGGQFTARDLWGHSLAVGTASRMLAKALDRQATEEAFVAGLIHDLGLLVERQAFPEQLAQVIERVDSDGGDINQVEMELMGADHQGFGLGLTTKWKFPRQLRVVCGYHHKPNNLAEDTRELPMLVHIADRLTAKIKHGFYLTADQSDISDETLACVGLTRDQINLVAAELPEQLAAVEATFTAA